MAARVLQLDLNAPLAPIPTSDRYAALWILVRVGRRPIGWVRCRRAAVGNVFTPTAHALIQSSWGQSSMHPKPAGELPEDAARAGCLDAVVVCRGAPEVLERQLASLCADYPNYEVIVVDTPRARTARAPSARSPIGFVRPAPGWITPATRLADRAERSDRVHRRALVDPDGSGLGYNFLDPA